MEHSAGKVRFPLATVLGQDHLGTAGSGERKEKGGNMEEQVLLA